MLLNNKYIGCNYNNKAIYGGINSSFNGIFTNEEVIIEGGFDITPCIMGDVSPAYDMLKEKIKGIDLNDINLVMEIIFEVVHEYFGGIDNVSKRRSNYVDVDFIFVEDDIGKVSSLMGKGEAMCVERAMLTQNLLKKLNIDSYYKCSSINVNGKNDVHSYNVINIDNKYYIIDTSLPTIHNDKISPLIGEIPEEVYASLIRKEAIPNDIETYSIEVTHYNPLRDEEQTIIYDKDRANSYKLGINRTM